MDIVWIIAAIICMILAFIGCFLPILPGPPIAYLGLILIHITDRYQFSMKQLLFWGVSVIIIQILDYIAPMLGTKYSGGSKWGNWGCIIGTLIGIIFFAPWGIILGPFIGAFIGEILGGKDSIDALKSGFGAFLGFLISVVLKVGLCGYFLYCLLSAFI